MDRFHELEVFVAVAEELSFAGAARRMDVSPAAVTRAIGALEDRLGVRLLRRTTRQVSTTAAGDAYLEDARRLLLDLQSADAALAGTEATPRGQISITAPQLFGRDFVLPGIMEYLGRYPESSVNAVFLDRVVNLLDEGLDVGIRIAQLEDSGLIARHVGSIRTVLCASPDYVRGNHKPDRPEDLTRATTIAVAATGSAWQFREGRRTRSVRLRPRLTVTTNDAAIAAAVSGFGIVRLLSYQVAADVQAGRLQLLLEDYEPPPRPVSIVHREGRRPSARVRAFVDLLTERLRGDERLNPGGYQPA